MEEIIIGTYELKEKTIFSKSYESLKYYTKIEVEPTIVDVYRFNDDACYDVVGMVIADDNSSAIGKDMKYTAQPYAYKIIESPNFKPNDRFFIEFPHLYEKYERRELKAMMDRGIDLIEQMTEGDEKLRKEMIDHITTLEMQADLDISRKYLDHLEKSMKDRMKCSKCGKYHHKSLANCCWVYCSCGAKICGQCGSTHITEMDMPSNDDEAQYWCCLECTNCGLEGCGMCI